MMKALSNEGVKNINIMAVKEPLGGTEREDMGVNESMEAKGAIIAQDMKTKVMTLETGRIHRKEGAPLRRQESRRRKRHLCC